MSLSQVTSKNYVTAQLSCTVIRLWASSNCNTLSSERCISVSKELSFPKEIIFLCLWVLKQQGNQVNLLVAIHTDILYFLLEFYLFISFNTYHLSKIYMNSPTKDILNFNTKHYSVQKQVMQIYFFISKYKMKTSLLAT